MVNSSVDIQNVRMYLKHQNRFRKKLSSPLLERDVKHQYIKFFDVSF